MMATELQSQLDQGQPERKEASPSPSPSEEAIPTLQSSVNADPFATPTHKSSVGVDPFATESSARFQKGDKVHMSQIVKGDRVKGTYTIHKARLHASKAYCEYQLLDAQKQLYNKGEWVREKVLKVDQKR
ncbi:hypothetical protein BU24DRAFT_286040 [Aaosphaeria arxii CBS 175.79]|uniref:Uncharacterized protein n=1 Tax=Aaosphaeria arxii CBS 175.79 TaxID=1450172 RepID=A0A6A5XEJ9_9PLEO|nr:uncharacterized protein BU24DRAFT_286040 [Aaosphaeria arxii CBS 175.79]KAF2011645.1 hypothetical protein BU24DRAFT_286040 [Aaosphaeria arxii CBS 175.79]